MHIPNRELPLFAFLMMRAADGVWTVSVCRNLDAAVRKWDSRAEPESQVAVLHFGISLPPPHAFEELADGRAGKMLLTEAAKHCLPASFVSSDFSVGTAENCAVFVGLRGWGYSMEDPTGPQRRPGSRKNVGSSRGKDGWVAGFAEENPFCGETLSASGIYDDLSYLKNESGLERPLRHKAGVFRVRYLAGEKCDDPSLLAHAAPPWLAERELEALDKMTVRAANIFAKNGIRKVRDLAVWSPFRLLGLKNFGRESLKDVSEALNVALASGPVSSAGRDEIPCSRGPLADVAPPRGMYGWVFEFAEENPFLEETLSASGIYDDQTYMRNESGLEMSLRRNLGVFRVRRLAGEDCRDPCLMARAAPPWLADREFAALQKMTVRAANVFAKNGIRTVRDLADRTPFELLELENFGRKSLGNVSEVLNAALAKGPVCLADHDEIPESRGLLAEVLSFLSSLSDRDRRICTRRMEFEAAQKTLQELAGECGVTRERVRQIEGAVTRRLIRECHCEDVFEQRLLRLMKEGGSPLSLAVLETEDHWFEGVSSRVGFFRNLLRGACGNRIHVIETGGSHYLSFMDQESWKRAVSQARSLLSSGADRGWDENSARSLVRELLPESSREFGRLLWDESSRLCFFSSGPSGSRTLIGYGRGAEQTVRAILTESESPLHYKEIVRRARRLGKNLREKNVHNALINVGILFAQGTYGLERHVPLSGEHISAILSSAENIVRSQPSGRQWHASEILSELSKRLDDEVLRGLDKYTLNFVLSKSDLLESLKKMVWVTAGQNADNESRIDIRQAIISILEDAGRPLAESEIKKRLSAARGVNSSFQIHLKDPLIRTGRGVWGLKDRDIPFSRPEQKELLDELAARLREKGSGIHAEEIPGILDLRGGSAEALFSIAVQDGRFKAKRQYVYLAEWGDPRRETIAKEAALGVLKPLTGQITLEEIVVLVEQKIGRKCNRAVIYECLRKSGASYDRRARTWSLGAVSENGPGRT